MQERYASRRITPQSLDSQVADVIREQILSGQLSPGFRLIETQLAEQFSLSRGTIRAALQQLTHEGLVTQILHRGWTVAQLSMQDTWELYTLRNVLESFAARLVAESINAEKKNVLKTALKRLANAVKTKDLKSITNEDFALHKTIIQLSDHQRLHAQYTLIEQQIRLYIACCDSLFPDLDVITEEHEALVDVICSGNGTLAEQTAREHNSDGKIFTWLQTSNGT